MEDSKKAEEVLGGDRQALWSALRLSITQRFGYLQQMVPPSLTEPVAAELDKVLWGMFERVCGFEVPRGEGQGGLTLSIPEVPYLDGCTFQELVVRLPVRLHGWGFRSLRDTCGPAWLGTLETAVPYMAGRGEVCTQLEEGWGGRESGGEDAPPPGQVEEGDGIGV